VTSTSSDTPTEFTSGFRHTEFGEWACHASCHGSGTCKFSGGTRVPPANRLDSTDANFVYIIRTSAGIFRSKSKTPNAPIETVDLNAMVDCVRKNARETEAEGILLPFDALLYVNEV
jgi:hypothetical protein